MSLSVQKKESSAIQEYRAMFDILPDIVYRLDIHGKFTFVNNSIRNLGYEPKELIGKHFSVIIVPEDVERISYGTVSSRLKGEVAASEFSPKLFDERRAGDRITRWLEVRLLLKNKTTANDEEGVQAASSFCLGEVMATGVYHTTKGRKKGTFTGTVGIIRDITLKKKQEEEHKLLEKHYQQAQRLEAIGLLAAGIAHDFKNYLTIALGYIDIANSQCSENPLLVQYLDKSCTALQRSKVLAQQLLTFSKSSIPQRKPVCIDKILKGSSSLALVDALIKAEYFIDKELWPIMADEMQILQVIDNLVINARQAMPQGGILEFHARNREIGAGALLPIEKGNYVEFAIIDNGSGIKEEDIPKIFDPFFTTKQDGSGLGLSSAYFIIKNHQGHIAVDSKEGQGTTFTVVLPAQPPV